MESHELETAASHAIHALPANEAAQFERLTDRALEEELDSFRRVAVALIDGLPDIGPAPSPVLWDRIAERSGIATPAALWMDDDI